MPIFFAVWITRQAISPRLAIRIFLNISRSPMPAASSQLTQDEAAGEGEILPQPGVVANVERRRRARGGHLRESRMPGDAHRAHDVEVARHDDDRVGGGLRVGALQ